MVSCGWWNTKSSTVDLYSLWLVEYKSSIVDLYSSINAEHSSIMALNIHYQGQKQLKIDLDKHV